MTENVALVYASVCIFGVSVCCVRACFRSKREWLSHTPPAFSYVLDQTFHLLTTILLCPAAGTLIHSLSLSHRRSFYSPPSHPPRDAQTLSDPPKKTMFIHTCSHTCGCQSQSHSMQSDSCRLPAKASQRTKA